jgi:hypothetical protein
LQFPATNKLFFSGETMKKLQLFLAVVFTLVLTTATFAGEIDTGGKTPPSSPPASATPSGEIAIDPNDNEGDEYQLLEVIVPDLFQIMLSVF